MHQSLRFSPKFWPNPEFFSIIKKNNNPRGGSRPQIPTRVKLVVTPRWCHHSRRCPLNTHLWWLYQWCNQQPSWQRCQCEAGAKWCHYRRRCPHKACAPIAVDPTMASPAYSSAGAGHLRYVDNQINRCCHLRRFAIFYSMTLR